VATATCAAAFALLISFQKPSTSRESFFGVGKSVSDNLSQNFEHIYLAELSTD